MLQPKARQPVEPPVPVPDAPPPVRTVVRRRGGLVGVGVALVALGALAFLYVSGQLNETTPVVAVVSDVERGAVITAADIDVAHVVPDPALSPLPASGIDEVVAQRAAADLVAGSVVTEASVTSEVVPAAGQAVVGVALSPPQMPGEPLLPGDSILIAETPAAGESEPLGTPSATAATVLQTHPPDRASGQVVVDVLVARDQALRLVAQVATGRVGVVLTSRER